MSNFLTVSTPLDPETAANLRCGDMVQLTGVIYTARDAAHARMAKALEEGRELPFDISGQVIYYAGPTPTPPGRPIGAIGPTTSTRMDAATPALLARGLRGMIGKGGRSQEVVDAMRRHGAVYFAAVGGAAALMARCVTACEVIAWDDLGPESVKRLTLRDLPLIVAIDAEGGDAFEQGQAAYLRACKV